MPPSSVATVTPISEGKKHCPHCDKVLRSHNKRGVCSKCALKHRGKKGKALAPKLVTAESKGTSRQKSSRSGTEQRFRILCNALGKDADGLLAGFMEDWIESLKKALA